MDKIDTEKQEGVKIPLTPKKLSKTAAPDLTIRLGQPKGISHASSLNQKQFEAVSHHLGPALVIAGAGTGKTRVITERIAHILRNGWAKNEQVLALTFTDKAAREMEERLDIVMPMGYAEVPIKTFHAFCDELLRHFGVDIGISPGFKILQGVDQWQFLKEHLYEFELDYYRPLGNPTRFIDALTSHFGRVKEELLSPSAYLKFAEMKMSKAETAEDRLEAKKFIELAKAYAFYQSLLTENNALDFADLQFMVIELFERRPNILRHLQNQYQFVLVDEYQDTNIAQNRIVDLLSATHRNLMVVGDDDQSIYKFRGAAISNILQFQQQYPDAKKIVLNDNYRSNQAILDLAYASIQHNNPDRLEVKAGVDKRLKGQRTGRADAVKMVHCSTIEQEVDYVTEEIKKATVPLSEIAVLCRANAYAQPFIEGFRRHNIPYDFPSEKGLYDKNEIRDLIAVLRVLSNPTDDISFYRVLRIECWGISMETIAQVIQAAKKNYKSIWKQLQDAEETRFLKDTLKDVLEFSKTHSAGETLHRFVETIQLYETLLKRGTLEAEEQIMNIASFFEKIRAFERNSAEATVIDFTAYLDLAEESGENPSARFETEGRDGVQISTVHAAKGLEFDTVFVTSLVAGRFPSMNRHTPIEMPDELVAEILSESDVHLQEERRLFYVAITRAKENLHLTYSDFYNPSAAKNPRAKKRSRFLDEIEEKGGFSLIEKTSEGVEQFLKPKNISDLRTQNQNSNSKISDLKSEIKNFSYSQLTTFESCPRQYQYQYIFKIPSPPAANLSFGSSIHNTLQEYYKMVGQSKQASLFEEFEADLSLDRLLKIYEEKWIDHGYESKQHMLLRKERGKEILSLFYERFKNDIPKVKYLEKGFRLKIGNYTITGRIDRADERGDGTLEIIDYKTGKSRDQKTVDNDLQLALYALAAIDCFKIPASLLTLHFLDADEKVSTVPTDEGLEKARQKVIEVGDKINASDFSPTPSKIKCQFCAYRKICDAAL